MSFPFDLHNTAVSDSHLPCHAHAHAMLRHHAVLLKVTAQHGCLETAALCRGLEKNGMVGAWHGKCETDTAALCKSDGKDKFQTLSSTAWQGHGMCAAWERHAVCESGLTETVTAGRKVLRFLPVLLIALFEFTAMVGKPDSCS